MMSRGTDRKRDLLIFSHRVNTRADLDRVSPQHGVEVDVRDYDGRLRLAHDPLVAGEDLDTFLDGYRHSGIIFNTKCDGLEYEILQLAQKYSISNYFFLDTALPSLVKMARRGVRQAAVRFSEYEPIEAVLRFSGMLEWVWVDCFSRLPMGPAEYETLRRHFRICLVSPELQGHGRAAIAVYRDLLHDMPLDAVCTDFPEDWAGDATSVLHASEAA